MKFGSVENPEEIDFALPMDHPGTKGALSKGGGGLQEAFVGCAKWNKQDLKGFYPRGTKDELAYYSTQFNSIELNATFYNFYKEDQIQTWHDKVPEGFKFFPKVNQYISHVKRLNNVELPLEDFANTMRAFGDKLGMVFLQVHNNFAPKNWERLQNTLEFWPKDIPLALELRHTDWYNDETVAEDLYALLDEHKVANIVTDTAGRRDLLHMRLTTPVAFVRYVGANHASDWTRLDDWIERIKVWQDQGLQKLYFFVHQNLEKESPLLSARFLENFNKTFGFDIKIPEPAKK